MALSRNRTRPLMALAFFSWCAPALASKIACVGDSITYGYNLSNPSMESYPAVLQGLLGSAHTVKNFGSSGCTLLKKGDKPYWNDAQFGASDAFNPDVVVVMLGTNDAKSQNWARQAEFTGDYDSMIDHYRGLGALVYVAVPPPVVSPGNYQIDPNVLNTQIVPLIRQIATAANAPMIDVYQAFNGKANLLPDTVHPNADGAKLIAQTVQAALEQGGFGGYAGTGGASSSAGGTQGSGGVKNTGGTTATGGFAGTGGLPSTGGRSATSLGLGGALNTGGVATTLTSSSGNLGTGGSSNGNGGATMTTKSTSAGHSSTGGTSTLASTSAATAATQGGQSASAGGAQATTPMTSAGGSSSHGETGTTAVTAGASSVATVAGQAGSVSSSGGSGTAGSSAVDVSQTTQPNGCGCRVQRRDASPFAVGATALLALLLLRRRRSRLEAAPHRT